MNTDCNCLFLYSGRGNPKAPHHNMGHLPIYQTWKCMKKRCFSSKKPEDIRYYQSKGIGVCSQWCDSFLSFYNDMGDKPSVKHSIDRIDGNKGYCPHNCKWSTPIEQSRNISKRPKDDAKFKYVSILFNGVRYNLGKFKIGDDLRVAYENHKIEFHNEYKISP